MLDGNALLRYIVEFDHDDGQSWSDDQVDTVVRQTAESAGGTFDNLG